MRSSRYEGADVRALFDLPVAILAIGGGVATSAWGCCGTSSRTERTDRRERQGASMSYVAALREVILRSSTRMDFSKRGVLA